MVVEEEASCVAFLLGLFDEGVCHIDKGGAFSFQIGWEQCQEVEVFSVEMMEGVAETLLIDADVLNYVVGGYHSRCSGGGERYGCARCPENRDTGNVLGLFCARCPENRDTGNT